MRHILHDVVKIETFIKWTSYEACGKRAESLIDLLNIISLDGWELVGEIQGNIYVKKVIDDGGR